MADPRCGPIPGVTSCEIPVNSVSGEVIQTTAKMHTELNPGPTQPEVKMLDKPFQRIGSISNAHAGADFERKVQAYFVAQGMDLQRDFGIEVGLATQKKRHIFDLGDSDLKVLVECKSHTWTVNGAAPSAKLTVWNEAMLYFLASPPEYRKILMVLMHRIDSKKETLAEYYLRRYSHLVPLDVEIWEFNTETGEVIKLHPL